jgi:hypothetical protein
MKPRTLGCASTEDMGCIWGIKRENFEKRKLNWDRRDRQVLRDRRLAITTPHRVLALLLSLVFDCQEAADKWLHDKKGLRGTIQKEARMTFKPSGICIGRGSPVAQGSTARRLTTLPDPYLEDASTFCCHGCHHKLSELWCRQISRDWRQKGGWFYLGSSCVVHCSGPTQ